MDNYEFDCINYADESDKEMYWGWRCLREVYLREGVGAWRLAEDVGRHKLARKDYEEVRRLAERQEGKASLLVDRELGLCSVLLEHVDYIQGADRLEKKHILTVLSHADHFTLTSDRGNGLCPELDYKVFRNIRQSIRKPVG